MSVETRSTALRLGDLLRRLQSFATRRSFPCVFRRGFASGLLLAFLFSARGADINPPAGPYFNLTSNDFAQSFSYSTNSPTLMAHYFYWYDIFSNLHITNPNGSDGLTDHPPSTNNFSYKLSSWHKGELSDMIDAGIDVLLAVSWGAPSERLSNAKFFWSFEGIGPLVNAREELLAEGKKPPHIGLFYDTSTLQANTWNERINLTTDRGRQWFYESIRDFFSLIPPKHWAMINGQPIVFLYASSYPSAYDQSCFDFVKQSFARDFGGRVPYIVREISWNVQTDNVYAWGGAPLLLDAGGVASFGPGYNDSLVQGRVPYVVDRENGALFSRNWSNFLRFPSMLAVIETWNEYHEGTDIAASREYGRSYIELNRKFADWFKQGYAPPWPQGAYSDMKTASVDLRATNVVNGVVQFERPDGATTNTTVGGSACRAMVPTVHTGRYIYFRVDDSFKWGTPMQALVDVEYYDSAGGSFTIEYDGSSPAGAYRGAYSWNGMVVNLNGTGTWKTARFTLTDARFLRRQNGGGDFRIAVSANLFYVRRVAVVRPTIPDEAGQVVRGSLEDFSGAFNDNWIVSGNSVFSQTGGVLKATSSGSTVSRLLWNIPPGATNEILARIRLKQFGATNAPLGGICIAVNPTNGTGFNYRFIASPTPTRRMRLDDALLVSRPETIFSWSTNVWYWLRLRHQTNSAIGGADVLARIWRADHATTEPASWLTMDYFPANPLRNGLSGIVAPDNGELECDFFLVKSGEFTETTVRLPAPKPAHAGVSPTRSGQLKLTGESGRLYVVENSTDLFYWTETAFLVLTNGAAEFVPDIIQAPAFYRTRFLP